MEYDPVLDRPLTVPVVERCVELLPDDDRAGRHWTQESLARAVELALVTDTPLDPTTCRIIALGLTSATKEIDALRWFGLTGMVSASSMRMSLESVVAELDVVPFVSALLQFVDGVPERDTPHVYAALGPLAGGWVDLGRPEMAVVEDLRGIMSGSLAAAGTWRCLAATGFGRLAPMHIERALFARDPVGRRGRMDLLWTHGRVPLPPLWDLHHLALRIMAHGDAFTALVGAGRWPAEDQFAESYIGAFGSVRDYRLWAAERAGWLTPLMSLLAEFDLYDIVSVDWVGFDRSLDSALLEGDRSFHAFRRPPAHD
ncbi:hypothetical protein GA707_00030 [Nostocoides sp. F2B08]|uniref:hypothetical protein n=1 Tax=Nostocoides sp. F2B08 TaxID=2653936 RepID=UPI00126382DA|nr:hypothetical protein [Tetrasphaera sp. F2B08]KAB7745975.1 hypothetical protein GA707_00030 [Tetrasphaera sp. F2B08]